MANDVNNNAEESFIKFVQSMYQYVKESPKDFAAIKLQLRDIFKTHRPIRKVDYQYGISKALTRTSQLIVHECNQRLMVREYFRTGLNVYQCCECNRTGVSKNDGIADLLVLHGIVFVKLEHDCAPRQLSFVQKVQKLYKEKKVEGADALQKKVLGSEDLIVPVKQKNVAAVKGGTKAASSKMEVDVIAEVKLRLAQQRSDNAEIESAIFDDQFDENQEKLSPEETFTKLIENLKEYSNESKEVVMANKSKILSILKSRHPLKMANYEYRLSENLQIDKRLIAFEWNDRQRVREYSSRHGSDTLWRCRECFRQYERQLVYSCGEVYLAYDIVFVPYGHNCKPVDYRLVMIYQKFLEEENVQLARRMRQRVNFTYGECSFTNMVNVLDVPSSEIVSSTENKEIFGNESNSKALTNSKRKMSSDDASRDEMSPVLKKSKLNKLTLNDTVTDENDPDLLDEKFPICNKSKSKKSKQHVDEEVDSIHIKPAPSASTLTPSIYHFEKPLTSKLQEICDKLNIEYRNKAAKLWDKIKIDQIDTESNPTETHYFETDNFYQILSIFFTGKSKHHEQITTTIIDAFREKMVSSGEVSTKKFNREYFDTVTGKHFSFIAKYLSCRILIFDGENGIKKYGKWKSSTSIRLTLVVAVKDGYYSIVLNL